MSLIEKQLHAHFASQAQADNQAHATVEAPTNTSNVRAPAALEPAFATVKSVVPGSPADSAGLRAGDQIRVFGYVNKSNNDGLRRLADVVQSNEGVRNMVLHQKPS